MERYDSYKDSGVEWIGEIPNHWGTTRIKYTSKDDKYSFIDGDWIESKNLSDDGIRYITTGNIGEGKYKEQGKGYISEETFNELNCTEIFEGDLIISRLSLPVGRSCVLPNIHHKVVTSVDNVILRPKEKYNKHFLNYQFNSPRYFEYTELISRGVTLTRISRGMLGNNPIVIPPLSEQQQIVSFLDTKTSLIDSLIEKTQQKIELLKEKRTSLINEVVTKGLNPNVEMKDSGVEWIGEIPSHWEESKFKFHSEIVTGNTPSKKKEEVYYTDNKDGLPWVKPTRLDQGFDFVFKSDQYLTDEGKNETRVIPKNSIMVCSIGNTLGKFGISGCEMSTNQQINSIICDENSLYHRFCMFFVSVLTEDLIKWTNFVTLPIFTKSDFEDTEIIIPPLSEQQQIVEYLDEQTQLIDKTISIEGKRIELLKEYRQSLISEVVTGKRKVV